MRLRFVTAVNYDTKILVLTFAGVVPLAAAYLYLKDFLYTKTTGRPAPQRYRDRVERWNHPLTRSRYLGWSVLLGSGIVLQAYMAGWSEYYRGWSRLIPIGWMISGAYPLYHLQKRWRRQQAELND